MSGLCNKTINTENNHPVITYDRQGRLLSNFLPVPLKKKKDAWGRLKGAA